MSSVQEEVSLQSKTKDKSVSEIKNCTERTQLNCTSSMMPFKSRQKIFEAIRGSTIHQSLATPSSEVRSCLE